MVSTYLNYFHVDLFLYGNQPKKNLKQKEAANTFLSVYQTDQSSRQQWNGMSVRAKLCA